MISGRETFEEINRHVNQAQSEIERADREASDLTAQLSRMRLEETEQFQKLAEFRLDDIRKGAVASRLDHAHRAVLAFLDQHKQALAQLDKDINRAQEKLEELEQQRESQRGKRDQALEALEEKIAQSRAALEKTAEYHAQQDRATAANEVARKI